MLRKEYFSVNGQDYPVYCFGNDFNGNPRYIVHYLDIGLADHVASEKTRAAGLRLFHGRAFGGGFTFTSYDVKSELAFILKKLSE